MRNSNKKIFINIVIFFFLVFSFCLLDVWLRIQTRWMGFYSIYEIPPNVFTFCWSVVFVSIIVLIPSRKMGKIIYAFGYYAWMIYAFIQYGSYMILEKILFVSDFLLAGEGLDYIGYILSFLNIGFIMQVILLFGLGIIGILLYRPLEIKKERISVLLGSFGCIGIMLFLPKMYGEADDFWANHTYEYERFINAGYDLELAGTYQFVFRDVFLQVKKATMDYSEIHKKLDYFFDKQDVHSNNEMTGIFKDKNIIVVMMESMDDWGISEESTPTISYMMKNGINFLEMYTPQYSKGYTFNTEFAFNTSIYPYSNGDSAFALAKNTFSYSLANAFAEAGYRVNSFHEGAGTFYNREVMHESFGYEKYHSYMDYPEENVSIWNDLYLTESDELWETVVSEDKFLSFVISYSAHLPYERDELVEYSIKKYPELEKENMTMEDCFRAKARITDDMFKELLLRLEEDGLLEDTVIVAFTDHYTYGLDDDKVLQALSENAGHSILENTPAFIYCAEKNNSLSVNKVSQITDLGPTVLNMFGMEVPNNIMGKDIFDNRYKGYVVFPNNTWLTNEAYVRNGNIIWNKRMSENELQEMNQFVRECYEVNDNILASDYYRYLEETGYGN